jgi:hypothetical protein
VRKSSFFKLRHFELNFTRELPNFFSLGNLQREPRLNLAIKKYEAIVKSSNKRVDSLIIKSEALHYRS